MISLAEILKRVNTSDSNNVYLTFVQVEETQKQSSSKLADNKRENGSSLLFSFLKNEKSRDFDATEQSYEQNYEISSNLTLSSFETTTKKMMRMPAAANPLNIKDRYAYTYQPGMSIF